MTIRLHPDTVTHGEPRYSKYEKTLAACAAAATHTVSLLEYNYISLVSGTAGCGVSAQTITLTNGYDGAEIWIRLDLNDACDTASVINLDNGANASKTNVVIVGDSTADACVTANPLAGGAVDQFVRVKIFDWANEVGIGTVYQAD